GVPQEGLGCTPSSLMRDAFIQNLAQSGVITQATADSICAIDYNNKAGLGSDNLVNTITTYGSYDDLVKMLSSLDGNDGMTLSGLLVDQNGETTGTLPTVLVAKTSDIKELDANKKSSGGAYKAVKDAGTYTHKGYATSDKTSINDISLGDLLSGEREIMLTVEGGSKKATNWFDQYNALVNTTKNVCNTLGNKLLQVLGGDSRVVDAVAYANSQMDSECWQWGTPDKQFAGKSFWQWYSYTFTPIGLIIGAFTKDYVPKEEANWFTNSIPSGHLWESAESDVFDKSLNYADSFLGIANVNRSRISWTFGIGNEHEAVGSLDLTNFTQAWFTYFMQYMEGLGSAKSNSWYINWRASMDDQSFATKESIGDYKFTFTTQKVSDNEALISNFYDTLFNQICVNGWTENNEVATDSSYLKEMLQTGKMYLTSLSDDYYFYQNNYATNTFVKEVSDDAAIAQAESKYTTEKARINAKEQDLDLKMKNLDTEISSLETEYEAVKKIIEGNVSKSFTRYDS
ncbi:MAG: hypothetical protein NC390_07080, partial [Fusobacterium sp.]|nr:hypothetical protein [Fusobacterium sp.]